MPQSIIVTIKIAIYELNAPIVKKSEVKAESSIAKKISRRVVTDLRSLGKSKSAKSPITDCKLIIAPIIMGFPRES